jgi:hypothetical protein
MLRTKKKGLRKLRVYIGERRYLPESTFHPCLTFPILVRKTRNSRNAAFPIRHNAFSIAMYTIDVSFTYNGLEARLSESRDGTASEWSADSRKRGIENCVARVHPEFLVSYRRQLERGLHAR